VCLGQEAIDVVEVMRRRSNDVDVERLVLKRQVLRVADHPVGVVDVSLGRKPLGLVQHLARQVETDHRRTCGASAKAVLPVPVATSRTRSPGFGRARSITSCSRTEEVWNVDIE